MVEYICNVCSKKFDEEKEFSIKDYSISDYRKEKNEHF